MHYILLFLAGYILCHGDVLNVDFFKVENFVKPYFVNIITIEVNFRGL